MRETGATIQAVDASGFRFNPNEMKPLTSAGGVDRLIGLAGVGSSYVQMRALSEPEEGAQMLLIAPPDYEPSTDLGGLRINFLFLTPGKTRVLGSGQEGAGRLGLKRDGWVKDSHLRISWDPDGMVSLTDLSGEGATFVGARSTSGPRRALGKIAAAVAHNR